MAGYTNGDVTKFYEDDLIQSYDGLGAIPIVIDTSARDAGNDEGDEILRPGLVLGKIDADGKYKEFDDGATDGTEDSAGVVVLAHEVRGIADGDKAATAYFRGALREGGIKTQGTVDWSEAQRLVITDEMG